MEVHLTGVIIGSADLDRDAVVYTAITGSEPSPTAAPSAQGHMAVVFNLGDARLMLCSTGKGGATADRGIERLIVEVDDLGTATETLREAGAEFTKNGDHLDIHRTWTGVRIEMRQRSPDSIRHPGTPPAVLDHVAILVADVDTAARRWTTILGKRPVHLGIHPLGTSTAARFLLADRMIELLAPLPDIDSPLKKRLERAGDGPLVLAIVARDLDATVAAVTATGARVVAQTPHLVVHPSAASGVPIQLTPRVLQ